MMGWFYGTMAWLEVSVHEHPIVSAIILLVLLYLAIKGVSK